MFHNEECAKCPERMTCPDAAPAQEEMEKVMESDCSASSLEELNDAIDEMVDSVFEVLEKSKNARIYLTRLDNRMEILLELLQDLNLSQLTMEE